MNLSIIIKFTTPEHREGVIPNIRLIQCHGTIKKNVIPVYPSRLKDGDEQIFEE